MNEVMHFTNNPETEGIAEVKISQNDNAYGVEWANLIREYFKTAYAGETSQCEVKSFGKTYKVLKRDKVTAFYDESGNTLFDVVNERLQKEYEWFMKYGADQKTEETDGKILDTQIEPEFGQEENAEIVPTEKKNGTGIEEVSEQKQEKESGKPAIVDAGVDKAEAKLKGELEKVKQKDFAKPIIEYLIDRCKKSESLAMDICQSHKTWDKCYDYIYEQAKKKLSGKSGPIRDDMVYEWAEDYYRLDDKALEEKKAKEEAERKKKAAEKKKQDTEKRKITSEKSPKSGRVEEKKPAVSNPQREVQKQKPKKNELDGQMDMFSLMGM